MLFFKKRTILDDARDFETQYNIAKVVIFEYLDDWFEQIVKSPDYKTVFGETDLHTTIAAQVENYLLGRDLNEVSQKVSSEIKEEILQIKDYIPRWTDDVMNEDKAFCEFIIQTVRMNMIFRQYESDCKWLSETPDGKRISEILTRYGDKVPESPDPKKYKKLLKEWMDWRDLVEATKKKLGIK